MQEARHSRRGLPVACGFKLPDGTECPTDVRNCNDHRRTPTTYRSPTRLNPQAFASTWLAWCDEHHRLASIPVDVSGFLGWWGTQLRLEDSTIPLTLTGPELLTWYRLWRRRHSGLEDLVPFDLSRFVEWWAAS